MKEDDFLKTNVINDSFYNRIADILKDKQRRELLIKIVSHYMDKNNSVLTYNTPSYRLYFYDTPDRELIFKLVNIKPEEIKDVLKKTSVGSSELKNLKEMISNPFNIVMMLIIKYLHITKDKNATYFAIMYLVLSLYANLHFKFYRYEPNDNIMQFTINRVSNKYLFKQYGVISKALYATAETNHNSYANSFLIADNDEDFLKYFVSLRSRLNNQMRSFFNEYMKDKNEGNYINRSSDDYDQENYKQLQNLSGEIVNFANKACIKFFSNSLNDQNVRLASKIATCESVALKNTLLSVKENEREKVSILIRSILQVYLSDNNNELASVGTQKFLSYCMTVYTKSNTKDPSIITIKNILNYFLTNYCNKYNQTEREATKNNYRKGLYVYMVLLIMTCK